MKKSNFFKFTRFAWVVLLAVAVIATSCKKDDEDDDPEDPEIVLDGTYVKGAGTALTTFDSKGMMKVAKNEVVQTDRATLLELYVAVKAGADGFNIVTVAGNVQKTWGPGADFAEVTELNGDEPTLGLWRGSLVETATKFTVPTDGLYHIAFDSEINVVTIAKVEWGVIGAATPGGWSSSTQLNATFDLNEMVFEASGVEMAKNEFKFRYSNGWKVILSPDFELGDPQGRVGIKVNSNYGGAVNALVPGGANIAVTESGIYTIKVKWSLSGGTTAEMTKTGDLQVSDWTNVKFDVFGSGVDSTQANAVPDASSWGWGFAVVSDNNGTPVIEGEVSEGAKFTYTWTGVSLWPLEGEGFAFRSVNGSDYNGAVHRFAVVDTINSDMTVVGSTTNGFGDVNINVLEAGLYNVTITIDAANEDQAKAIIVKNGAVVVPKLWVPGAYQGWAPDVAPTLEDANEDGVFVGTVEITGADLTFKFTSQADWAGTNYGAGATDGTLSTDGGAGNLSVPAEGTYLLTADLNNLTWSYVLQ